MRNSGPPAILLSFAIIIVCFFSCVKDNPASLVPPPIPDQSFTEQFDTVAEAFHRGWIPINNSDPKGTSIWAQGGGPQPYFPPFSSRGSFAGFIGTDYLSTSGDAAVISNWLISPLVILQNGDKIIFYTRTLLLPALGSDSTDYGNNLEVCINNKTENPDVGIARDPRDPLYNYLKDRGDFDSVLSINPPVYDPVNDFFFYRQAHSTPSLNDPLAYPPLWTRFEVTVKGLEKPHKGRFAFRYYTLDGGSNGNASAVGIDNVTYVSKK